MSQTKAQLIDPVDGTIVNADINESAAIAGSKISPSFTSDLTITDVSPAINFIDSNNDSDFQIIVNDGRIKIKDITNSNAVRFSINSSGNVGIGTTSPDGQLHVFSSSAGSVTAASDANNLVLEASANVGLSLLTANDSLARIKFGDPDAASVGAIVYNHADDRMQFNTAGSERMRVDSSGRLLIGTTTEGTVDSDDLTIATSGNTGLTIRSGTTHNGAIHFSDATSGAAEYAGYIDYDHNVDKFDMGSNSTRFLSADSNSVVTLGKANFGGSSGVIAYGNTGGVRKDALLALNASATVSGRGAGISVGGTASALGSFYCNKSGNNDSDGGNVFLESVGALRFLTGGANDRVIIDSSGKVGIGTTSPESNFHINVSSASDGPILRFTNPNGGDGTYIGRIQAGDSAGSFFTGINFFKHDTDDGEIRFRMKVAGSNTDLLTLVDGRVGIGQTSPVTLLTLNHATNPAIQFQDSGTKVASINAEGSQTNIASFEGKALVFATSTDSTFSERMRIQTDGRVAIGNTGPKAGLHVATENTTYGKNAVFGANGWVNNANYHYTDATISLLGQDADGNNKGAGIEFSTRNTANTNWRHGAINQERDSDLVFILGGSGTFQGVERLRIKGNGLMAFNSNGTVNATYQFDYAPATGGLIVNANAAFTGNSTAIQFRTAPSTVSGNITLTNNGTTTAYGTSSDYRLKENAVAISDGITRLKTLKPYRFNFKSSPATTVDGFFAHEVTAVPEAITGTKDETKNVLYTEEDTIPSGKKIGDIKEVEPVYQSMDYAKITPLLTAALQEAITKIETLESEVAVLKAA